MNNINHVYELIMQLALNKRSKDKQYKIQTIIFNINGYPFDSG